MSDNKKNIKLGEGALQNNGSHLKEGMEDDKYPQNNIAMGDKSLHKNIRGNQNSASGGLSLSENIDHHNNSAFGFKALKNSDGKYNTALGAKAGTTLRTGYSNTLIGKEADTSKVDSVNETVIGANAVSGGKNTVTLGNSKITEVNMSQSKNAELNCGEFNIYDSDGNKLYSLPKADGKAGQVLKTKGNGELIWEKDNKGSSGKLLISNNPPTANDRSGNSGDLRYDNNFLYLCLGNNNWEKIALEDIYGLSDINFRTIYLNNIKQSNTLRIASYNIQEKITNKNIGTLIDTLDLDIIGLQEAGDLPIATYLDDLGVDSTKYNVLQSNAQQTNYGADLSIIYKKEISVNQINGSDITLLDINSGGLRDAMLVQFSYQNKIYNVINVHLDSGNADYANRQREIESINQAYDSLNLDSPNNLIILGDFNWYGKLDGQTSDQSQTEWDIYSQNTWTYLGSHTIDDFSTIDDEEKTLFYSEYAEGSSRNKYLEIYNPTSAEVDLTEYAFPSVSNAPSTQGQYEYWNAFPAGAKISAGGVYIIAHEYADASIIALANHKHNYLSNGDDGYALVKGTQSNYEIIDFIGSWHADPGSGWPIAGIANATKDHTIVRKSNIYKGNPNPWWTSNDSDFNVLSSQGTTDGAISEINSAYISLMNDAKFGINSDPLLLDNNSDVLGSQHNTTEMLEWSTDNNSVPPHIPNIQKYASSLYSNNLIARLDCIILGKDLQNNYKINSYKVVGNPFDTNTTNFTYTGLVNNLDLVSDHLPIYLDLNLE